MRVILGSIPILALAVEAAGDVARITWVHWGDAGRPAYIQSQDDGVEVSLKRAGDNRVLSDAEVLREAGWNLTSDGFMRSPERSGGEKIITVSASGAQCVGATHSRPRRTLNNCR